MQSYSQAYQDIFACILTDRKTNGYFVEIGSNHPIYNNNTYLLSKYYGWQGVMIEYDTSYESMYREYRPESKYIINDARNVNYREFLDDNQFPENIDYLQIDLDVNNRSTIDVLENFDKNVFDKYTFATITFEHDMYATYDNNDSETITNYLDTKEKSKIIFQNRGYLLLFENVITDWRNEKCAFEDWYIHPDLVDMNIVSKLKQVDCNNIHCKDIYNMLQNI